MNSIHPTAVIDGDVALGDDNVIGAFVVITGPVTIGSGNWIGSGVVLGAPPEVRSFRHPHVDAGNGQSLRDADEARGVVVGDRVVIREHAQIHQGWQEATTIGDDVFMMNQVYVAHDGVVEAGATLAGGAKLAGHVVVGGGANIGLGVTVHQRRRIGRGAMVGMGSVVTRDVPDFAKAYGNPARVRGVNRRGAELAGLNEQQIAQLAAGFTADGSGVDLG